MPRHATWVVRRCEVCGATFQVTANFLKRSPCRYCSKECLYRRDPEPLAVRFGRHVGTPTGQGCVLWGGSRNPKGYGQIRDCRCGELLLAHRVAWELVNGPVPEGLFVLHDCPGGDNPACVNVEHLRLGTAADNTADMVRKGRQCKSAGVCHPEQVRAIRERYARGGISLKRLGQEYGVSASCIYGIVRRRSWRHVG